MDLSPFFVVGRYYAYNHKDKTILVQAARFIERNKVEFQCWPEENSIGSIYIPFPSDPEVRKYFTPLWYDRMVQARALSIGNEKHLGGEWMLTGPGAVYVDPDTNQVFFVGPKVESPNEYPRVQILADWSVHEKLRPRPSLWLDVKLVSSGTRRYVVGLPEDDGEV